jgi:hypothetical protein
LEPAGSSALSAIEPTNQLQLTSRIYSITDRTAMV